MAGTPFSPTLLLSRARRHPHTGIAASLLLHLIALVYVSPSMTRQVLSEPGTRMTVRMHLAASEPAVAPAAFGSNPSDVAQRTRARETYRPVLARRDAAAPTTLPVEKQNDAEVAQPDPVARASSAVTGEAATQLPALTGAAPPARSSTTSAPVPTSIPPGFNAAYLDNPAPAYPALSRRIGEQGKVLLRVYVEADGHPSRVELRASSGFERLDQSALDAVRRWRFTPARHGEQPVADWVVVPIAFNLKSA